MSAEKYKTKGAPVIDYKVEEKCHRVMKLFGCNEVTGAIACKFYEWLLSSDYAVEKEHAMKRLFDGIVADDVSA